MQKTAVVILLTYLCGCSTPEPQKEEQKPIIPVKIAGNNIPPNSRERIRYDENIKAYPVGRYIDPNNSRIMYEKTTMYRIEEDPVWNLKPNQPYKIPYSEDAERKKRLTDAEKPLIAELDMQVNHIKRLVNEKNTQQQQIELQKKQIDILQKMTLLQGEQNNQFNTIDKALESETKNLKDAIKILGKQIEEINKHKTAPSQNNSKNEDNWTNPPKNDKLKGEEFKLELK